MNKENTFIKQVERTAKFDAYLQAIRILKYSTKEEALSYLLKKADNHRQYLAQMPLGYDFATQTLLPKEYCLNVDLISKAMESLQSCIETGDKS